MFTTPYIIGDRLNTSNRSVGEAVKARDCDRLRETAMAQVRNGANALDVCAAAAGAEELAHLDLMVSGLSVLQSSFVLSIDTQDDAVAGAMRGKAFQPPILNCYSGLLDRPDKMLAAIRDDLPVAGVIAVCVNFQGTHVTVRRRLDIAGRMAAELLDAGVVAEQVIFDPVTLPATVGEESERVTLETMRLLRQMFPTSGVLCASSNYSYGLLKRLRAERGYVRRSKDSGASVFLLNALDAELCAVARG